MALKPQSRTLSRERDQRRALLKNLAESLILHESIVTTTPKAKALRPYVEKLVTKSKTNTVHNRRQLMRKLCTQDAVNKLLNELGPRYQSRPGGYTSIKHEGWRRGDDASMSRISLIKETEPEEDKPTETAATAGTKSPAQKSSATKPAKTKNPAKTNVKAKSTIGGSNSKKSPAKKESA